MDAFVQRSREPAALNELAWQLAVSPNPRIRNPARALALAKSAVAAHAKYCVYMDTLAAAYAANGDFVRAIAMQKAAIPLAKNAEVARRAAEHLAKFERGESLSIAYRNRS